MLKNIVDYLDNNPLVGILIIFVIVYFFWSSINAGQKNVKPVAIIGETPTQLSNPGQENIISELEHFGGLTNFSSPLFSSTFASTDMSKTVNLRCTIDGVNYYLANIDNSKERPTEQIVHQLLLY
jgi:hypothetical protein